MSENKIDVILGQTCGKHRAPVDFPCWSITTSKGDSLSAVCNRRAKKAGFNGSINPKSMRKKAP